MSSYSGAPHRWSIAERMRDACDALCEAQDTGTGASVRGGTMPPGTGVEQVSRRPSYDIAFVKFHV